MRSVFILDTTIAYISLCTYVCMCMYLRQQHHTCASTAHVNQAHQVRSPTQSTHNYQRTMNERTADKPHTVLSELSFIVFSGNSQD